MKSTNRSIDFELQNSNCTSMHSNVRGESDELCANSKSSLAQILLTDQLNRFQIDRKIESKEIDHCPPSPSSINQTHCDTLIDFARKSTKQSELVDPVESSVIGRWLPVSFAYRCNLIRRFSISQCPPSLALLLFCFASSTCLLLRNRWITNLVATSTDQTSTLEQLSDFDQALTVRTDCGSYIGTVEQGAFSFKVTKKENLIKITKNKTKENNIN